MEPLAPNHVRSFEKNTKEMLTVEKPTTEQERELVKPAATALDTERPQVEITNSLENEEEYPKGAKLVLISLALCLAVFLVALGATALLCCLIGYRN